MPAIPFQELFQLLLASLKLESPIVAADSHSDTLEINVTRLCIMDRRCAFQPKGIFPVSSGTCSNYIYSISLLFPFFVKTITNSLFTFLSWIYLLGQCIKCCRPHAGRVCNLRDSVRWMVERSGTCQWVMTVPQGSVHEIDSDGFSLPAWLQLVPVVMAGDSKFSQPSIHININFTHNRDRSI